jgi:hypothetical protein
MGIGLAVPGRPIRSLVAEAGAPEASTTRRERNPACSRLAHETVRHRQEQRRTATSGGEAKAYADRLARSQMDTSERRSNDS